MKWKGDNSKMEMHRYTFEERVGKEKTTLLDKFPIAKAPIKTYFAGAALLARSRYLVWIYKRKMESYHTKKIEPVNNTLEYQYYKFVEVVASAYCVIDSVQTAKSYECDYTIKEAEESYEDLYYLLIRPFVEIYENQRKNESEEKENEYSKYTKNN